MTILHGTWVINRENQENSGFFIWGEIWRSLENQQIKLDDEMNDIIEYPQGMSTTELENWLQKSQLINLIKSHITQEKIFNLPSYFIENKTGKIAEIYPLNSVVNPENNQEKYLHPWKIPGFYIPAKLTTYFLTNLPLNPNSQQGELLGEDIKFWIHIARWSLDLIARGKFLPTIEKQKDDKFISKWQAILDSSIDNQRLEKFAQKMPLACCSYQQNSNLAIELPILPRELIIDFLNPIIDSQIRIMINSESPIETKSIVSLSTSIQQWLLNLINNTNTINHLDPIHGERLQTTLTAWMLPLESQLRETSKFRTCLQLYPPTDTEKNWKLGYYLQAIDNSEFIIDAKTIWQHPIEELVYSDRSILQPQETFLRGLGLASRIYPIINQSLETETPEFCYLTPVEAYQFIKSIVWKLEDSGIGVILPSSLMQKDGFANRLGLKLTSANNDQKQQSLGLQSLLNFEWQLTIGGQIISKKQFDKLVALNSPLVEINGEWVELRSQDIKTAQNFFVLRQEQMTLSLEDALRISTGDTQIIEKLPVVSFETSGILQELISTLTNNQEIQSLPTPVNFKGELRPYQQRGVGWLTFLEKWGLGACLADDMGLGKCVGPDTLVNINGKLLTAENIWNFYAGETVFDGEGFWSNTNEKLLVNSINEKTGKIIQAPINKLYRQQVRETLRKVTLEDGSSITITRQHKLLTHQGWNNHLNVGDYVCVPSKKDKLDRICQKINNTNVEGIPASDIVAQAIKQTGLPLRHLGMHNTVYINGSQQFSRESLERVLFSINQIISGETQQKYQLLKPSKLTAKTIEAYTHLDMEQLKLTQQYLQRLLEQEVYYCKIKSIEDVDYEGWVYDFEVSEHHNFVANNIICHNTVQFIAFLLHLQQENKLEKPTLLVCPTSVLGNWEREVKKFAPNLKVLQYHGDKRPKGKLFSTIVNKHDLVITSYSLVHRDLAELETINWQIVVLDEAQNVKNHESKQSQAVRKLKTTFRIALTGTPVENRLQELWSILEFLNPGYLGNKQFFQRRFAMPIEKYGDSASLNQLRSLVQPFILRRLKTDKTIIQDLPEKQEMNVFCGLSTEQATLYQNLVEESLQEIDSAAGLQRRGMILGLLVKLKQICNHPAQYLKLSSLEKHHSAKLQRLEEMLEEVLAAKDKALIFTQFAEWGKLLKPHLEKQLNREIFFLYGSTTKKQREEMIDRFQHDPQGPPIMILSLKAGGVGLNLTKANHVFHFDRWWNPAVENQATDRVFRIGQTRNVQVYKFVCTGTLEEKINDMIEGKKQLAEQVVSNGEDWLTEMDTDQLRNLLILDRDTIIDE
ncbi:helicase [Anabaena sp. FACHB-1237]|uniref:SNF2-related protein n=1 Tax=Anabaena sp. FACHB-1237 TaxID=2692769 RepID=UPI00168127CB|nr:SNF2-related protein [Anabaena sp. FACHB-1237]MBD2136790.1 helicase [Anabaena sp. FACHB-1237]